MRVRAVFFDAGNTLIRMDYPVIVSELARLGCPATPGDLERAEWRARVRLDASFAPGASTEHPDTGERYLRFILDELGVRDLTVHAALAAWRRAYNAPLGFWTRMEPEADAALALARARGLRTAVISNSNGTVADILAHLGLAKDLEFVIDSSRVGVEKPDPRIFHLALERAGLRPDEAVYVGDLYSIDVVGARAAGMRAILMDPGACWGSRDCPLARTARHAVEHVLGS
ncbi:MAG TPA: HAD family hydrolase [Candidatus Binatia bacterium]|nr:HAD family hydrolase [Candidatus Binatia bacterium]